MRNNNNAAAKLVCDFPADPRRPIDPDQLLVDTFNNPNKQRIGCASAAWVKIPPVCYLTVTVYNTDYDDADEYVMNTTANGAEVHGECTPRGGAPLDMGTNMFTCASTVPLPWAPGGVYTFETTATPAVDEKPYEGSFLYVEYMVACAGTCAPPSAPPSPPPLPPT